MTLIKRNYPVFSSVSDLFDDFFQKDFQALSNFQNTIPAVNIKET